TNSGVITITDNTTATPYPSSVKVNCVRGVITRATVTLRGLTHAYPDDIDLLLVGPNGQKVVLMSDAGGGQAINNINLTFDDQAFAPLPDWTQIVPGAFRPMNYDDGPDSFPSPAPPPPYASDLSSLNGTDPNGFWSLFALDDYQLDGGAINAGWVLSLSWGALPFQLSAPRMMAGGSFRMTLQAQPQSTYVIQFSSDLRTWLPLSTNTL